jgi:hypothetical protein
MRPERVYRGEGEEDRYVARNRRYFMTPFEIRAEELGGWREKARDRLRSGNASLCDWAHRMLDEYMAKTDVEIEMAIGPDLESFLAFQQRVSDRISGLFDNGELAVLHCPQCDRVVFSPETRQCVWCGHDWRKG